MHDWPPPSWTVADCLQADVDWVLNRTHKKTSGYVNPRIAQEGIKSVVEFGCGSGLLAAELPSGIEYLGIDTNEWFLGRANDRNLSFDQKHFVKCDAREREPSEVRDLSMAWSFLKHFGLDEFDSILTKLLGCGRCSCFNISHLPFDIDDGTDFHHVYVTEERVRRVVETAGHEIVDAWAMDTWAAHDQTARGVAYWTRRKQVGFDREAAEKAALTPMPSDIVIGKPADFAPGPIGCRAARLELDGYVYGTIHEYSLRWLADGTPVLYHKGKRVTKKWRLSLDVDVAADQDGGNANTAE